MSYASAGAIGGAVAASVSASKGSHDISLDFLVYGFIGLFFVAIIMAILEGLNK